ncbi:hypothetical protein H6G97_51180 [Nostoc flagelliforme FACHB-838]|uniref:Transposase n=1 Tax=Nostoc flagelliforme FACHB-838 TaxID=2692904 RepID=A0ABR8E5U0_9NOSO|nr:hypothetical protein [Nostoc flagelliforme]MBD2537112.1 hypothetical protein [Nostoc flagelliforme FACHB-838]
MVDIIDAVFNKGCVHRTLPATTYKNACIQAFTSLEYTLHQYEWRSPFTERLAPILLG